MALWALDSLVAVTLSGRGGLSQAAVRTERISLRKVLWRIVPNAIYYHGCFVTSSLLKELCWGSQGSRHCISKDAERPKG